MAAELDIDPDELKIKEASGPSSFGVGTVYEITIRGGGHKEWQVVADEDAAHELALAIVKQDLEESPENFNQSFIEGHIDMDRLKRDLWGDTRDSNEERLRDEHDLDFWREWEAQGLDMPEENEDGELESPDDSQIEELAERLTESELQDPMEYLENIYGKEDAVKKAIEIAGIDEEAAAEEAVSADGEGHFLSDDGNTETTDSGLVYWRVN